MRLCNLNYIDMAYNLQEILQVINLAHCINTITLRPCLRFLIGQHYFKNLATYTKSLDLTNISIKPIVLGSITLYYAEKYK